MNIPYKIVPHAKPCAFKTVCATCKITSKSDRPRLCISIECEHFTPCKKCGANNRLNEAYLCTDCIKGVSKIPALQVSSTGSVREIPKMKTGEPVVFRPETMDVDDTPLPPLAASISEVSYPGTPPSSYDSSQTEYYLAQWEQYHGFFRDPSVYAIIHAIIMIEIELNIVINYLIQSRLNVNKELEKQRDSLIENLKTLRGLLPEKDANEDNDADRAFSRVYEDYVAKMADRRIGKIYRIFSNEAIALAPELHFPVNMNQLLSDLGYSTETIEQAMAHFIEEKKLPADPKRFLEFLGYFLEEKYALPVDSNAVMHLEEEEMEKEVEVSSGKISRQFEEEDEDDGEDSTDDDGNYLVGDGDTDQG